MSHYFTSLTLHMNMLDLNEVIDKKFAIKSHLVELVTASKPWKIKMFCICIF